MCARAALLALTVVSVCAGSTGGSPVVKKAAWWKAWEQKHTEYASDRCNIPQLDASEVTRETFHRVYRGKQPLVIRNNHNMDHITAAAIREWGELYSDVPTSIFQPYATAGVAGGHVRPLGEYLESLQPASGSVPTSEYLCNPTVIKYYPELLSYFTGYAAPEGVCRAYSPAEALEGLEEDGRGGCTCQGGMLTVGPAGMGLPFHWHGEVSANQVVYGRKRWFASRGVPPGGGSARMSPITWLQHVYPSIPQAAFEPSPRTGEAQMYECMLSQGDAIYLPHGFYHATLSVDYTVTMAWGACDPQGKINEYYNSGSIENARELRALEAEKLEAPGVLQSIKADVALAKRVPGFRGRGKFLFDCGVRPRNPTTTSWRERQPVDASTVDCTVMEVWARPDEPEFRHQLGTVLLRAAQRAVPILRSALAPLLQQDGAITPPWSSTPLPSLSVPASLVESGGWPSDVSQPLSLPVPPRSTISVMFDPEIARGHRRGTGGGTASSNGGARALPRGAGGAAEARVNALQRAAPVASASASVEEEEWYSVLTATATAVAGGAGEDEEVSPEELLQHAIAHLRQAVALNPLSADHVDELAAAYEAAGPAWWPTAYAVAQRAQAIAPDALPICNHAALILSRIPVHSNSSDWRAREAAYSSGVDRVRRALLQCISTAHRLMAEAPIALLQGNVDTLDVLTTELRYSTGKLAALHRQIAKSRRVWSEGENEPGQFGSRWSDLDDEGLPWAAPPFTIFSAVYEQEAEAFREAHGWQPLALGGGQKNY